MLVPGIFFLAQRALTFCKIVPVFVFMAERTVMHLSFAVGRVNISQCMVAASLLRVATLAPKVSLLFAVMVVLRLAIS